MALKNIGGVWKKSNKENGEVYFSGEIEFIAGIKTRIVLMKYKPRPGKEANPKAPAFTVCVQSGDDKRATPGTTQQPTDHEDY